MNATVNESERNSMARSKSKRRKSKRKQKSSIVGNIMMEVLAIAAFLALLSASKDYSSVESSQLAEQPVRTAEYSSMLQGYFSDQLQRHGVLNERR